MQNKKTFKILLFSLLIYMLLSWFIAAGTYGDSGFVLDGFNQFGLFDFLLAPINLFNYFVVTLTQGINGYVNQLGYGNIIIAFLTIGIFYGVLNETEAYSKLVYDAKNKFSSHRQIFLLLVATIFFLISSFTGLNLLLFMFLPFLVTVLIKLKYRRVTAFTATIGAMLLGQIGSLFNPTINGLNRVIFSVNLDSNLLTRIVLFLILLIILLATLILSKNTDIDEKEELLLFEERKGTKSYIPIIISTILIALIIGVCMYNWYYMFKVTNVTEAYNTVINTKIAGYNFTKNIFGMMEPFGYWSGFTMSALLLLESLVLMFIYNINMDRMLNGIKRGIKDMAPTIALSIVSLVIIVVSLKNNGSFIYSIINRVITAFKGNVILGLLPSTFIHSFVVNDYFAVLSSLSVPITNIFGADNVDLSLLVAQVGHGLASLVTPFNVFLIAGLSYLKVSYVEWLKYIWKTLLIILGVSLIILFIASSFA